MCGGDIKRKGRERGGGREKEGEREITFILYKCNLGEEDCFPPTLFQLEKYCLPRKSGSEILAFYAGMNPDQEKIHGNFLNYIF